MFIHTKAQTIEEKQLEGTKIQSELLTIVPDVDVRTRPYFIKGTNVLSELLTADSKEPLKLLRRFDAPNEPNSVNIYDEHDPNEV